MGTLDHHRARTALLPVVRSILEAEFAGGTILVTGDLSGLKSATIQLEYFALKKPALAVKGGQGYVALPLSSCSRQTKPGDTSARALTRASASKNGATRGSGIAATSLADGQPFPPGRYQCEAYLDGKLELVSIFNIDFPPRPTASIPPGSLCYGFYKKIDVCPKYGVTSRDPARCRCTFDKGWECDP